MAWSKYDSTGAALESALTDFPVGSVVSWAADTAPTGWLKCDGTAISRTGYPELFGAIGTSYGTGDGSTTFNLPTSDGEIILATSTTTRLSINTPTQVVTSFPRSPRDGQEVYYLSTPVSYATPAATPVFHARYNAAATQWQYIGPGNLAGGGQIQTSQISDQVSIKTPFCRLYRSTDWTFANNTVEKVPVATAQHDNGVATTGTAMADTANNRIYARRTGIYYISGILAQNGNSNTQWRNGYIRLNGSTYIARMTAGWGGTLFDSSINISTTYYLTSGDYVELWHWNNTSGSYIGDVGGIVLSAVFVGSL